MSDIDPQSIGEDSLLVSRHARSPAERVFADHDADRRARKNKRSENMDDAFDVEIPWHVEDRMDIILKIHNPSLLGSNRYFIRFDLYPQTAPSTLARHHGFWDVPLRRLKKRHIRLTLSESGLVLKGSWIGRTIIPGWKGDIRLVGYSMLHVSLWDRTIEPPEQVAVKSSSHLFAPRGKVFPLEQILVPVTQRCNLRCFMCMRHSADDLQESDISEEVLSPILDAAPLLSCALLNGVGEPLLNTGLAGIVEAFKARMPAHGKVGYTTNGMLMDEARAAQLVDAGTNWICFSLDGAKRATAESIRIGIDFERVIKHIGLTVERRRVSGRKNLWLTSNFVIMDRNLDEMSQMVRLAASLGLDSISFNYHRNFRTGVFSTWSEELLQPRFEDVRKLADSLGVDVLLPRIGRLKDPRCTFMQMAYLHLSGEVVPCCRMLPGGSPWPIRSFGNVRERPLLDIWHSSEYVEFRSRVADGDFPEVCVKCDYKSGLLV